MPSEFELSPEQRVLLKELPFKAIFAAVVADVRGPVGSATKETIEGARALVALGTTAYAGNPLVQQVLQAVADDPASEPDIALKDETARVAAVVEALRFASEGATLLDGLGDPILAHQFKRWVLDAATATVEATRSGGIFGNERVSDEEEDFLRQLRVALGLPGEDDE